MNFSKVIIDMLKQHNRSSNIISGPMEKDIKK